MFPNFVLLFLLNSNNEILLLRRINTPFCNNYYCLPGTKIEPGQDAKSALMADAIATFGIKFACKDIEFLHVMHRKCNEPEFFACVFKIMNFEGKPINLDLKRYDDLKWFPINKLPLNIVDAHKQAIHMIKDGINYSQHGWEKLDRK